MTHPGKKEDCFCTQTLGRSYCGGSLKQTIAKPTPKSWSDPFGRHFYVSLYKLIKVDRMKPALKKSPTTKGKWFIHVSYPVPCRPLFRAISQDL